MKILVIGDVHGLGYWEEIVNNEEFDHVVFVGDYMDSYTIGGETQVQNLKDIIAYKRDNMDKVTLLLGNHDIHYIIDGTRCGGFLNGYQYSIRYLFEANKDIFQMCKIIGNYCFTHAGVTKTWAYNSGIDITNLEQEINDLWTYRPNAFLWFGTDEYGDDVTQSPVWVRPKSLTNDRVDGYIHVVGHTAIPNILIFGEPENCIFVDCLPKKKYIILDVENG